MTDSAAVNEIAKSELTSEDSELKQFLTFAVDNEEYGVDLLKIREIKGWTATTRLPNSPNCMRGIMNLRGSVIPIFDLKGRFSMGETAASEKHVVIIIAVGKKLLGILVDSVSDIVAVPANEIRTAPQVETKISNEFIDGLVSIGEKMVVLLNIDRLFSEESLQETQTS